MRQFKKYNRKQHDYSNRKVRFAKQKLAAKFLLFMGLIFTLQVGVSAIQNPTSDNIWNTVLTGTGSVTVASMAVIGNFDDPGTQDAVANQIHYKVWLISVDQVDYTQAMPQPNANREIGDTPLNDGEYPHYFDFVNETVKDTGTIENGEIVPDFTNGFNGALRGNSNKLLDWIEEYAGRGFIIIYSEGEAGTKKQLGTYYKPMMLQTVERKNDNEGRYLNVTFQNKHWRQPLNFVGTLSTQAPVTVAAGSTNLPVESGNDRYQLADHTAVVTIATVSGIASADHGRIIEVLAPDSASNAPEIADNTVFILKDGTTWTANPGSKITFKIFDNDTLVEQSRVQTA
jgi:hypothetical protein